MTLEQIEKQMWDNYDEGYKAGCSETINKVCEWINKNIYKYTWINHTQMEFGINRANLLSDLKQVIENEQQ